MSKRCCAKTCYNSQKTNRNVAFFGFPKSEEFATKWAMAAGREDLLNKSLNCINKYTLCSEHFENDCFLDPPYNTKLKKTSRPITAPIPTIFCNNLNKFIPRVDEYRCRGVKSESKNLKFMEIINEDALDLDSADFQDNNYESFIFDESLFIEELLSPNSPLVEQPYKQEPEIHICRLCAKRCDSNEVIPLLEKEHFMQFIKQVLPQEIQKDDGLPQHICPQCTEKLNICLKTINEFSDTQNFFRQYNIEAS